MKGTGDPQFIRGIITEARVTHEAIASELGLTRSNVSTMLGKPADKFDLFDAFRMGRAVGRIEIKAARRARATV